MAVRKVQAEDYEQVVPLLQAYFPVHNNLQQEIDAVTTYLQEEAKKHEFLLYEDEGEIKAVTFLVERLRSSDDTHTLWKYRHFAFSDEDAASMLIEEVEDRVQSASESAKVELTIAESEPGVEFFYRKRLY